MNRHNNRHAGKTKKKNKTKKQKNIRNKQTINNSNIRSTVIVAFGLLAVFATGQAVYAQGPSRFDLVPASNAIAACLPNASARVAVSPREDIRGVDTLDLHAEGLRPNTTFAIFLTQ